MPTSDKGNSITSIELESSLEDLLEGLRIEHPCHTPQELCLAFPHRRPRLQSDAFPQPLGSTQCQRGVPYIAFGQRELCIGHQSEGHRLATELGLLARLH